MPFSLLPRTIVHGLPDLTPKMLKKLGVELLMLDFDNTVVPYTTDVPTPAVRAWFRTMQASGICLCVVSNSKKERVQQFCRQWDIPCFTHCRKPSRKGILRAAEAMKAPLQACALAGDQIYTDTLAANRAGVRSILVEPIHLHNVWLRLRHVAELPFIHLAKRRMKHEQSD